MISVSRVPGGNGTVICTVPNAVSLTLSLLTLVTTSTLWPA